MSFLSKFLFQPRIPHIGAGFIDDRFVVVDMQKRRGRLSIAASAYTVLPPGLICAEFDSPNITNPAELAEIIMQTAEGAGLANRKKWSVTLPQGVARTVVVSVEGNPTSRKEIDEIVAWKVERALGISTSGVRMSREPLPKSSGGQRYLVAVSDQSVLAEYEAAFQRVGWQVGLLLPRLLGEAEWLLGSPTTGDKLLISAHPGGFASMIVRDGEPLLIRTHDSGQSFADEVYRVVLFYMDRFQVNTQPQPRLEQLMIIGDLDRRQAMQAVGDATGITPHLVTPSDLGLDLEGEPVSFDLIAAPSGPAILAWK
jgi:hypothetical protein